MVSRDMLEQYRLTVFPLSTASRPHVCSGGERFHWLAYFSGSVFSLQGKGVAHELAFGIML